MDLTTGKRVYMTGFMHCNQRVKQGIWIDRLIIGLILHSCLFLFQTSRRVGYWHGFVNVGVPTARGTGCYALDFCFAQGSVSGTVADWLQHDVEAAAFCRVGLMKSLYRRVCFCYHIFSFSRLETILTEYSNNIQGHGTMQSTNTSCFESRYNDSTTTPMYFSALESCF